MGYARDDMVDESYFEPADRETEGFDAGLLREIVVDPTRSYFDTTTHEHGHFFHETSGQLLDIVDPVQLAQMPSIPAGTKVSGVYVVIRLKDA